MFLGYSISLWSYAVFAILSVPPTQNLGFLVHSIGESPILTLILCLILIVQDKRVQELFSMDRASSEIYSKMFIHKGSEYCIVCKWQVPCPHFFVNLSSDCGQIPAHYSLSAPITTAIQGLPSLCEQAVLSLPTSG